MAKLNVSPEKPKTHEGATAKIISPEEQLRRSICSTFLWEDSFYEDGESIADRIVSTANKVDEQVVADLAIEARTVHGLRHAPLLLLASLAQRETPSQTKRYFAGEYHKKHIVRDTIAKVIQRPDEMGELLMVLAKVKGVEPDKVKSVMTKQVQRGLADAFTKFDGYQLAKYKGSKAVIKLKDVLRLVHPKPKNEEQSALFVRLDYDNLEPADTWEVALSGGEDKKETFTRLLREEKLGYMALLRNLRNMVQADVDHNLVEKAIVARKGAKWVLPFRYVVAARHNPSFEPALDKALIGSIADSKPFSGTTIVLVDVSYSMVEHLSGKSELNRMDAACVLGSIINGDRVRVFSFSGETLEVPYRLGMAGVDALKGSQYHNGTRLAEAVSYVNKIPHDRLIVITDEQASYSYTPLPNPVAEKAYMINVAPEKNGVGYRGGWTHIDGFSEAVLRYIHEAEALNEEIDNETNPDKG